MAATITNRGSVFNTTAGNKTVTATPAVGDLIIVVTASTGVASTVADNQSGVYVQIGSTYTGFSTTGNLQIFARTTLVTSSVSTIYTATQTSSTGGGLLVYSVAGISRVGSNSLKSSGGQSTGGAGTTPAPVLSATPLSANPIISAVGSGTNSTTTVVQRTGYTESFDNGYATPTTGLEVNFLASGETSATITYGGTSSTAFASIAVELDMSPAIIITDSTTPTDSVKLLIPILSTGVLLDSTTPTDSVTLAVNPQRISVTESTSSGDVLGATNLSIGPKNISITDTTHADEYGLGVSLVDSYDVSNQNAIRNIAGYSPSYSSMGQSFTALNGELDSVKFYLSKTGSPTGNIVAKLYNIGTGTSGVDAKPNAVAIATSDAIDVSTLTASLTLYTFNFSGANRVSLSASNYIIQCDYGTGTAGNVVNIGCRDTTPTDDGNGSWYQPSTTTWFGTNSVDFIFYLYENITSPTITAQIPNNISILDSTTPTDNEIYDENQPYEETDTYDGNINNYVNVVITSPSTPVNISVSDSTSATESILVSIPVNYVSVLDTTTPTDLTSVLIPKLSIVSSDTSTPVDTISVLVPTLTVSVSDSSSPVDSIGQVLVSSYVLVQDSSTPTDTLLVSIPKNYVSILDSTTPTDTVNLLVGVFISTLDSSSPIESITAQIPKNYVSVLDSTTPSESVLAIPNDNISVSDSSTPTESISLSLSTVGYFATASDSTTPSDSLNIITGTNITVSDSTSPTEVITASIPVNYISCLDNTTPTDSLSLVIPKLLISLSDSTAPQDQVLVSIPKLYVSVSDNTTPSEAKSVSIANNQISVTDSTTPSETINILIPKNYVLVSDSTIPTDSVNLLVPNYKLLLSDNSTPTDSSTVRTGLNIRVSDNTTPNGLIGAIAVYGTSLITISDSGSGNDDVSVTNIVSISESSLGTEDLQINAYVTILDEKIPGVYDENLPYDADMGSYDGANNANDEVEVMGLITIPESGTGIDIALSNLRRTIDIINRVEVDTPSISIDTSKDQDLNLIKQSPTVSVSDNDKPIASLNPRSSIPEISIE